MINKVFSIASLLWLLHSVFAMGQGTTEVINKLDLQLKSGKTTVSKVLENDFLMYLHSLTPFREVIKANAKAEHISIISDREPGIRITIKGLVTDEKGNTSRNLTVYFYQTSDKGWYSDTAAHILVYEGDIRHARLFGYLKTDNNGVFSFTTIKPKGYPKSDLAAHIHIHFWDAASNTLRGPGELQFDDDPRMTPERQRESIASGYLISRNSGTEKLPVYEYKIVAQR